MTGKVQPAMGSVWRNRQHAQRGEQPVLQPLVFQHELDRRQDLRHRPPGEHHGPPGHPQADAQRGLVRPAAAHVPDDGVYPPVAGLDHVIKIAAQK